MSSAVQTTLDTLTNVATDIRKTLHFYFTI